MYSITIEFRIQSIFNKQTNKKKAVTVLFSLFVVLLQANRCVNLNPRWVFFSRSSPSILSTFCILCCACMKPAQSPFRCYFNKKCSIEIKQANEKNKLNLNISTSLAHSAMKIKSMGIRIHTHNIYRLPKHRHKYMNLYMCV